MVSTHPPAGAEIKSDCTNMTSSEGGLRTNRYYGDGSLCEGGFETVIFYAN